MTTTDTDAPERIWLGCDLRDYHPVFLSAGAAFEHGWNDADGFEAPEYIRADLAKPRVKPLVWTKSHGHGKGLEIISHSLIGRYLVQWTESECHAIFPGGDWRSFGCKKAAKAAADAHHTAHVLAQLEGE